ncbi:FAD-binding oxidoreductase [Jeotgalibacillus sp. R-1-5s-1]|uniref:NAD(P)/FAD-dependent oxidoreductase n=1 Tax=Jeotgalibacillus sp. R-1-5s-1 TaxID=2555897 RepID=UPI001069126F|nr:FAD-dependent oxidoreductase [Jeotgalibacillus sp. R-1-5s-1]TFE00011.1 FAD-binding oxidoreductase [Jeotgalibacillus sp. R-1-5s-1]
MSLHKGKLYWPETIEAPSKHRSLESDQTCDVLIIGGGMAAALCAEELSHTRFKTIVVEKGEVAKGSSAANTGLLQFSNDKMLHEFIKDLGEEKAVRFYKSCLEAVDELQQVAGTLAGETGFIRRPSLYYASTEEDVNKLKKEYEALHEHGFEVEYLDSEKIKERFGFEKPAAIMTHGDAEVNPNQLIHRLFESAETRGITVYENAEVQEAGRDGEAYIFTSGDHSIRAERVIYCTGYETIPYRVKDLADLNRSYAIATSPVADFPEWTYRALIWETKRPYFYMRTTEDGRIIAGGLDEEKMDADVTDEKLERNGDRLIKRIKEHFPDYEIQAEYKWCATFGESEDGLPFIGPHPEKEGIYYCLGFGGNGTVYSKLGAKLLCEMFHEEHDQELAELLDPGR